MTSSIFLKTSEMDSSKKRLDDLVQEVIHKLISYKPYLSQEIYTSFLQTLAMIDHETSNKIIARLNDELTLVKNLLNEKLIPENVSSTDLFYDHTIERICFRGEDRPPYTKDNQGIFEIGFSKTKVTTEYESKSAALLKKHGLTSRVIGAFESNMATTNAFSTHPAAAAFFPLRSYFINNQIKKNEYWIYVVFIEKGFDVSHHGYRISASTSFTNGDQFSFFAKEICSDIVPTHHIIAAYKAERDLSKLEFGKRINFTQEYKGSGIFKINELIYNEAAIKFFSNNYNLDVEKYKKLLEKYMTDNQKKGGENIHLSRDGYTQQGLIEKNWIKNKAK